MKYRKKPVEIEAMQLQSDNIFEVYKFIHGEDQPKLSTQIEHNKWDDYVDIVRKQGMFFKTLESHGEMQVADIGDFIIKGVKGEFYPCKPDIFELTYDKINHDPIRESKRADREV
ncbi:MAG: hypothetical protein K0S09_40 [Sphingobacteriaceae bacterium]|jgi:hypothetical protein|nr:hypothetical protein [Sphingobacteriaceae bacterium]